MDSVSSLGHMWQIGLDAHWSLLGFLSNHEKYIFIGEPPEICKDDSPAQSSGPSLACFTPTTFLVNCIACTSHDGEPTAVSQQSLSKLPAVVAKTTFDRLWSSTMKWCKAPTFATLKKPWLQRYGMYRWRTGRSEQIFVNRCPKACSLWMMALKKWWNVIAMRHVQRGQSSQHILFFKGLRIYIMIHDMITCCIW